MWSLFLIVLTGGLGNTPQAVTLWSDKKFDTPDACAAYYVESYQDIRDIIQRAACVSNTQPIQSIVVYNPSASPTLTPDDGED